MREEVNMYKVPLSVLEDHEDEGKVCIFCDTLTYNWFCGSCQEYKGLMTIESWESYTGEVWEA